MRNRIRIGVLSDSGAAINTARQLLDPALFDVVFSRSIDLDVSKYLGSIEFVLLCVRDFDDTVEGVVDALDEACVPFLVEGFEDLGLQARLRGSGPLSQVSRRLTAKIRCRLNDVAAAQEKAPRARFLWVLGASTGGPAAVNEFLREIPDSISGVAFLYLQHIDQAMLPSLVRSLKSACSLTVEICDQDHVLREGHVYLAMPDQSFEVNSDFELYVNSEPWIGSFKPSVDQVLSMTAKRLRFCAGAIVFSGMGNDGAASVGMLSKAGGQVWVQSPDSCLIDSMPVSVLKKQQNALSLEPKLLAKNTIEHAQSFALS